MMNRKLIYISLCLSLTTYFLTSCTNDQPFIKDKWNEDIDPAFSSPYRNKMLKDLMTNHKLIGLKYSQLTELLGSPDFNDSISIAYRIIVDYGSDIDPVYTKNLNFTFSKDSIITAFKIDEWKK